MTKTTNAQQPRPSHRSTYFKSLTLQAIDESCDWRALLSCRDTGGRWWTLYGQGRAPGDAAESAWSHYLKDESEWLSYGYVDAPDLASMPATPVLTPENTAELALDMCLTLRPDYLEDSTVKGGVSQGMTAQERKALMTQMQLLVRECFLPSVKALRIRHELFAGVAVDSASLREVVTRLARHIDPNADLEKFLPALSFQVEMARALISELVAKSVPVEPSEALASDLPPASLSRSNSIPNVVAGGAHAAS